MPFMNSPKTVCALTTFVPVVALLAGCSAAPEPAGLSLEESCASLSGITSQLAEGIGLAQDDPSNAQEHLDISRAALQSLRAINSEDASFTDATRQVAESFTAFLNDLQQSIENGGGVDDPAIIDTKEAARSAGQLLDQVCQ